MPVMKKLDTESYLAAYSKSMGGEGITFPLGLELATNISNDSIFFRVDGELIGVLSDPYFKVPPSLEDGNFPKGLSSSIVKFIKDFGERLSLVMSWATTNPKYIGGYSSIAYSHKGSKGKLFNFTLEDKGSHENPTPEDSAINPSSFKPAPLSTVHTMYHPVTGTSADSVYHVVATSKSLNMAARHIGDHLSIRVEGDIEGRKEDLVGSGLSPSSTHWSGHFAVGDHSQKKRAFMVLGSVMAYIGGWDSPLPDMEFFYNNCKGV